MTAPNTPADSNPDATMDELRLFISLRALADGASEPGSLRTLQAEVTRLEKFLAANGAEPPEPFSLDQEDLDNLFLLKKRQSLEPEDKVRRIPPIRWVYKLVRKLFLGTQRRYNESVSLLVRKLYASALLTRYYQLRSLALERRIDELQERLRQLDLRTMPKANSSASPPEPSS